MVEELKREARKVNLLLLREEINEPWVLVKIQNHLLRNPHLNYSIDDIKSLILENDLIGSFFCKDPAKQNISEKLFADIIRSITGVENFSNLPSSTNQYLIHGEIQKITPRPVGLKSIDYIFSYNGLNFACSQKYTMAEGGAQDNQYNDLISFLYNSTLDGRDLITSVIPIVLIDGEYYTENRKDTLKNINPLAIVCSSLDLEKELDIWINKNL